MPQGSENLATIDGVKSLTKIDESENSFHVMVFQFLNYPRESQNV